MNCLLKKNKLVILLSFLMIVSVSCQKGGEPIPHNDGLNMPSDTDLSLSSRSDEGYDGSPLVGNGVIGGDDGEDDDGDVASGGSILFGDDGSNNDDSTGNQGGG